MTSSHGNIFRVTCFCARNSPVTGQWLGALIFFFDLRRINSWANTGTAGDLKRHRAHYDVIVMLDMVVQCCKAYIRQAQTLWCGPRLPWIFPGAPLEPIGALGKIQGNMIGKLMTKTYQGSPDVMSHAPNYRSRHWKKCYYKPFPESVIREPAGWAHGVLRIYNFWYLYATKVCE